MIVFTGQCSKSDLRHIRELKMGIMLQPLGCDKQDYGDTPLAFDNGAFRAWRLGYPFMERLFWKRLEDCFKRGWRLQFLVCPDLIARGYESLAFSLRWANEKLAGCPKLALAVQDGMVPSVVHEKIVDNQFSHIFVGGTEKWKWDTAQDWVQYAHDNSMKCHIGRCGTRNAIDRAVAMGVDSVDSSSIVRNKSWDVVRKNALLF